MKNIKDNLIKLVKIANSIEYIFRELIEIEINNGKDSDIYKSKISILMELFRMEEKYLDEIDLDYIFNPDMTVKNDILKSIARNYANSDSFTQLDDFFDDIEIERNLIYARINDALLYRGFKRLEDKWIDEEIDEELINYIEIMKPTSIHCLLQNILNRTFYNNNINEAEFEELRNKINNYLSNASLQEKDYCISNEIGSFLELLKLEVKRNLSFYSYSDDSIYLTINELDRAIDKLNSNDNISKTLIYEKYQSILGKYSLKNLFYSKKKGLEKDKLYEVLLNRQEVDNLYVRPDINDICSITNRLKNFIIDKSDYKIQKNYDISIAEIIYEGCSLMAELYMLNNPEVTKSYINILQDFINSVLNNNIKRYSIVMNHLNSCFQQVSDSLEINKAKKFY